MEIDQIALDKYNELKKDCLDNEVFAHILKEVEKEIIDKFKLSPELAVDAHYEYQAFQRVLNKIKAITISGELEIQKLHDENYDINNKSQY